MENTNPKLPLAMKILPGQYIPKTQHVFVCEAENKKQQLRKKLLVLQERLEKIETLEENSVLNILAKNEILKSSIQQLYNAVIKNVVIYKKRLKKKQRA